MIQLGLKVPRVTLKDTLAIIYDSIKTHLRASVFSAKIYDTVHNYKLTQFSVSGKLSVVKLAFDTKEMSACYIYTLLLIS